MSSRGRNGSKHAYAEEAEIARISGGHVRSWMWAVAAIMPSSSKSSACPCMRRAHSRKHAPSIGRTWKDPASRSTHASISSALGGFACASAQYRPVVHPESRPTERSGARPVPRSRPPRRHEVSLESRLGREQQGLEIGWAALCNRRHSSIGTRTAVSTPRRVTIWGPSRPRHPTVR
jgi:hypothetical protein